MSRAQAALEFLTTYGWAILIVTVMIGALAYYGVINPKNLVKENCIGTANFQCVDHIIYSNGTVQTILRVNIPEGITNVQAVCDDTQGNTATTTPSTEQFNQDASMIVTCNIDTTYQVGDLKKINIDITYKKIGGQFNHTDTITIIGKVQQGQGSSGGGGGAINKVVQTD